MSWKEYNKSMQRKRDREVKVCGNCQMFDKCKKTKDVEKWNHVPQCKEAIYRKVNANES